MNIQFIPANQYLHELRSVGNLSDKEIADIVGLSRQTVWRLRTGVQKITTPESWINIANLHAEVVARKAQATH